MDVVVSSRNCEVSDRFREHVGDKLTRLEKHDHRIIRVDVVLAKEPRPREPERTVRIELTARSKGPIVRAEASAEDKMAALDLAVDKMAAQMRRAADRRKVHRGHHKPESVAEAMARSLPADVGVAAGVVPGATQEGAVVTEPAEQRATGPVAVDGEGPLVVRQKTHEGSPMTLEQALYEMELVGHDFYLFVDRATAQPSVVYRRRGYDYGVIALDVT